MLPEFLTVVPDQDTARKLRAVRLVAFDFDGVFTDNAVYVDQNGVESVRCSRSDGIGLARLSTLGVHTVILSTEMNPVVSVRAAKMKVACRHGLADKKAAITAYAGELGVPLADVAFVGNDINDVPALESVGLPIAVSDAFPEILSVVKLRTSRSGGHGAVREVCDLIYWHRQAFPGDSTA